MNKFNFKNLSASYNDLSHFERQDNFFEQGKIWKENLPFNPQQENAQVTHILDNSITAVNGYLHYLDQLYDQINDEANNQFSIINLSKSASNLLKSVELSRIMRSIYLINDVLIIDVFEKYSVSLKSSIVRDKDEFSPEEIQKVLVRFPLFFKGNFTIKIPSKVEYAVMERIPKLKLLDIHSDLLFARELCLIFVSQLTSEYFGVIDGTNPMGWKSLKAEYLRDLLSTGPSIYKKVIKVLKHVFKKGAIIECDNHYIVDEKSYCYRIGSNYISKGIKSYKLKSKASRELLSKSNYRKITKSHTDPICRNLIAFYNFLTLPTIGEIKEEANRLIKIGYVTKKNKKLTKLNKHNKSYFKDTKSLSFVEDSIEIFRYLTEDGLMIPNAGNEKSGGRIVDSFTLMPSWIRKMVKVNGQPMVEVDYSCLHPNIAMSLYGGTAKNLTHDLVGAESGIAITKVKIEHLSFFNKNKWSMQESVLYDYYQNSQPIMMDNIISEKQLSEHKHKVTSRRLFKKEVEIMTTVIARLNEKGIFVGYVYDALFCCPDHSFLVKSIMDEVIVELGVYTTAKIG